MGYLVGTDGSPVSETAVAHAATLAAQANESLTIVHVLTPKTILLDGKLVLPGEKEALEWGEETINRAVRIAQEEAETVSVQTELLTGRPAEAITDHAAAMGSTGIIVGHRGDDVEYDRVGSVAKTVVDKASVPVTIVK